MSLTVLGSNGASGSYTMANSLRLRQSASASFSRTPSSAGNRRTWTWSAWVKRGELNSTYPTFFDATAPSGNVYHLFRFYNGYFYIVMDNTYTVRTNAVFRDPSSWYHIVVANDTTQGTASNRLKIWVNGVQQSLTFDSGTYPSLNFEGNINGGYQHSFGKYIYGNTYHWDGYVTEAYLIDGQALAPTDFGEYGEETGAWQAKAYTGTYGSNGYYLDMSTSGSTITDQSGNSNNWTASNMNLTTSSATTYDIMSDVPTLTDEDTANFATLNPVSPLATSTLQDANLQMNSTSSSWKHSYSTIALPNTGKWYFEMSQSSDNNNCHMGIAPVESLANGSNGYVTDAILTNTPNADGVAAGGLAGSTGTWTGTYNINAGDALACAVDMDANKVWFRIGSNWIQSGDPSTGTNPAVSGGINTSKTYHFIASAYAESVYANFGQRPFQYTVPTGFKKLNTYNLPDSTIADGSQYFDVVTYTGTDTDNHISIDFTPDFVWSKSRSDAQSNILYDSIRGNNKYLVTNSTNAEGTAASDAITFDSDGYTWYQDYSASNRSPYTYVNWAWRGSDSAPVTNTDGSITTTVSANPTSGFSVVTWTGTGTSGQSIGHGLNQFPEMVIIKKRNKAENWYVASEPTYGRNYAYHAHLNTTGAWEGNNDPYYLGGQTSSTTAIYLADGTSNNGGNENGINYVAYCWHSVEGYSKIGSYTGNGSTDGPFVYTGFRPAFVMVKNTSTSATNWCIHDTSRETYNISDSMLLPNNSAAEVVSGTAYGIDILSNGFKIKNSNSNFNTSGNNYIYMAFAENPFKNSLAR